MPGLHLVVTQRTSSGDSRFKIHLSESYFNYSWPRMREASAAAQPSHGETGSVPSTVSFLDPLSSGRSGCRGWGTGRPSRAAPIPSAPLAFRGRPEPRSSPRPGAAEVPLTPWPADRRRLSLEGEEPPRQPAEPARSTPPHYSAFRADARKCVTETRPGPPCFL